MCEGSSWTGPFVLIRSLTIDRALLKLSLELIERLIELLVCHGV